jgi:hypothetical protein
MPHSLGSTWSQLGSGARPIHEMNDICIVLFELSFLYSTRRSPWTIGVFEEPALHFFALVIQSS